MAASDDRRGARGGQGLKGRRGSSGFEVGDEERPQLLWVPWVRAGWSVAGAAGLFALVLGLEPALGTGSAAAAPSEWDLAFHIALEGESRRPDWRQEAPAETLLVTSGGAAKSEAKRAAEAARENPRAAELPVTARRIAGAGRSAPRLAGLSELPGAPAAGEGNSGADRNYRRGTSVLAQALRKGPVKLAPPPRLVAIKPQKYYCPNPPYPPGAKKSEKEGSVNVKLLVSDKGFVSRWEIQAVDPRGIFEKGVKEVIRKWKFSPALDQFGKPIECWMPFSFTFQFEGSR